MPVLPRNFASPAYCAITAFVPKGREAALALVLPLTSALGADGVPLAEKTTLPVGRSADGGTPFTAAVDVTLVPGPEGFTDGVSEQEVVSAVMACEIGLAELSLGLLLSKPVAGDSSGHN